MHARLRTAAAFLGIGGLLVFAPAGPALMAQEVERPPDWSLASHGNDAAPDYERLFAMDRVHELRIRIAPEDFAAMQQDLATIGPPGRQRFRPGADPGGAPQNAPPSVLELLMDQMAARFSASPEACEGLAPDDVCSIPGTTAHCRALPGAELICMPDVVVSEQAVAATRIRAPGGAPQLTVRDPVYVPVTVTYDGRTWSGVGMRYKGNSSLFSAVMAGAGKIPFRLDFDRYEDEMPATRNQRFHGFQKLTFSSNFSDDSMLKEVLATEAFRDQRVPAARAAFYRIFVDTGAGDEYWGLYTMIEDPADGAMLDAQFGEAGGNLYKPEGPGANWRAFDEASFGKKTNESEADFADVAAAVAALHAPQENPAAWRAGLEASFDVDGFLRWLAVNSLIANWDSYGTMAHNYYLYGDPGDGGRLHWIPWDHNMSFAVGPGGIGGPRGLPPGAPPGAAPPPGILPILIGNGRMQPTGDLLHRQVNQSWPLISRILADDVYAARYRLAIEQALDGMLAPEPFAARVQELHALIESSVIGASGERPTHTTLTSPAGFAQSAYYLITQMERQRDAARGALATPP
jgi:hypothetical protein